MVREISRRKTNVCYHLSVESKKAKLVKKESKAMIIRGWEAGDKRDDVERTWNWQ